jgi:hypothetical protein
MSWTFHGASVGDELPESISSFGIAAAEIAIGCSEKRFYNGGIDISVEKEVIQ